MLHANAAGHMTKYAATSGSHQKMCRNLQRQHHGFRGSLSTLVCRHQRMPPAAPTRKCAESCQQTTTDKIEVEMLTRLDRIRIKSTSGSHQTTSRRLQRNCPQIKVLLTPYICVHFHLIQHAPPHQTTPAWQLHRLIKSPQHSIFHTCQCCPLSGAPGPAIPAGCTARVCGTQTLQQQQRSFSHTCMYDSS